jgi:putative hydrolase of the HAD superfamily
MRGDSPSAVLFDLDRTLCVATQDFDAVLAETFDRVGVDQYCSVAEMEAVVPETPDVESDQAFFAALFDLTARRADVDAPARRLGETYESLLDYSQVAFRDGAEEALAAARDHGPVGLVTNGGRETQSEKLAALGIDDAFDVTVFCDPSTGMPPKPDSKPVRTAVDALDVVPSDAMLVGDSKASDVAGAHAAGVRSAWVPYDDASDDGEHDPHHTFEDPSDLRRVL